jgi:hypothetical protein
VRVGIGAGDLEPDPAVVGHREQVVDGVQLAPGVVGVVDAADTGAELEAEVLVVAEHLRDEGQILAAYVEGDLASVDHDPLDGGFEVGGLQPRLEGVGDLVEPAAEGALGVTGVDGRGDQAAEAGGVAGVADAEHAAAGADGAPDLLVAGDEVGRGVLGVGGHS